MAIEKIWTTQYRRMGVAAYAESGRRDLDAIALQLDALMTRPGALFYKLEQDSVFLGYVIEIGGVPVQNYIRPHCITAEVSQYAATHFGNNA